MSAASRVVRWATRSAWTISVRGSASASPEIAASGPSRCQSMIACSRSTTAIRPHAWLGRGVRQREADAEAADEQRRGAAAVRQRVERGVDQQALGAAVGGVHQEAAVGDDLEDGTVAAAAVPAALSPSPQNHLAVRALPAVDGDRPVVGDVVRRLHGAGPPGLPRLPRVS